MTSRSNEIELWQVTYWNRTHYVSADVEIIPRGNDRQTSRLARTMAFHALERDGYDGRTMSFVKAERIG